MSTSCWATVNRLTWVILDYFKASRSPHALGTFLSNAQRLGKVLE